MYEVKLKYPLDFPEGAKSRRRAGIEVHKDDGYKGELTAEQVKAIKADPMLTVKELTKPGPTAEEVEAKKQADAAAKAAQGGNTNPQS